MNIVNQINAGLNDVRSTLLEVNRIGAVFPDVRPAIQKVHYELGEIIAMILDHSEGMSRPWSDRKHQIAEEFS